MAADTERGLELIGLIPAAGQATRISPLPCSKEIFPMGFRTDPTSGTLRPKVISHYLLEKMRQAGITRAYIILRNGKWDIPAYYGDGSMVDMHLAYLLMGRPYGPPYTLDQARPFLQNALVALGFPDMLFTPEDAFIALIARQKATQADLVLGLWPVHNPAKMDMIDLDESGRVRDMVLKPQQTNLRQGWVIALWSPVFTDFMHRHLAAIDNATTRLGSKPAEISVGHVIQAAVREGLHVQSVPFPSGTYLDIGTPEDITKGSEHSIITNGPQHSSDPINDIILGTDPNVGEM
jgi:glucose-1-phosphate thymidylyltransferase